jgi:phenylalanyl-tRNA synthetase alpha chain
LGSKTETDYRITKGTGWLEIGGCGMVDPNVLKNCASTLMSTTVLPLEWGRAHRYAIVPNGDIRMFMKMTSFLEAIQIYNLASTISF